MCGTDETKHLDHTFDRKSLLDAHPKDGVYGDEPSRVLGVGAHKKQEIMTSQDVVTSHVSTDNPISYRYPPVSSLVHPPIEKVGLVHKYIPVGVKHELVQEKYDSLDGPTLHQQNGNKPKAHPEKMVVKEKLKQTISSVVLRYRDATVSSVVSIQCDQSG